MKIKELKIDGMRCHHCVKAVEVELQNIGAESYKVEIGSAEITYDENKLSDTDIEKAVEEAGYKVIS